jgi:hypothetical protein
MATLNCKRCGMIHPVCDPCEGPMKPRQCTTHHHACDCREREFEKIREQRDELLKACEALLTYSHKRMPHTDAGMWEWKGELVDVEKLASAAIKKAKEQ